MLEINFEIIGAEAVRYAATPLISLKTRIQCAEPQLEIHNILLHCQIQIEPARRSYAEEEQLNLGDLFGAPSRWGQTLRPLLWTNADVVVPQFQGETTVDVPLPCTFDFNVAATKYIAALEGGDVPICALLSGTLFYATDEGRLNVGKIAWDREMKYRLPTRVWQEMMNLYYPNIAWLCLRRDIFEQIHRYKIDRGLPTWEHAMESLLASAEECTARKAGI